MRDKYPSDLTDKEWKTLKPLLPRARPGGRPEKYSKREIANAIFYLVRSGCSWRMLAHDLPPWRICYYYFMTWTKQGVWDDIHNHLRDLAREHAGKKKHPPLRLSTRKVLKQLTMAESVAMMQANGLWAERDTYSWTASDSSCLRMSTQQTSKTEMERKPSWRTYLKNLAGLS